ncbi:MAG: phosphoribosylglycinamide formyltransferase [Verrucomicrobiales bacterium]|nr:phosphoribosylglycinamide formyltransferase [Verrucomicrobiales bacterium]
MPQGYVSSIEEVATMREDLGREGRKLVLTNGAFDVLHVGHVRYLREAAALGDCLVVAINGDDSVRELKGEGRPVNGVEDRAEMLCALEFVDRVVVFEDRRATGVIEAIQPHIYTKGGDYTADSLIDEEKALLDRLGIEIQILSLVPGKSTSETLKQMSAGEDTVKKVAVLGSGKGSNAEAMMRASAEGRLGGEVALILTDVPGAGILDHAEAFGVPGIVIDPGTTKGGHLTDAAIKEILDRLQAASIDIVVLAGFMRILREPLLSAFGGRVLNIHPSLLPKYPGLRAVERAIEAGDAVSGCTIHLVDFGMDTGEILRQEEVQILEGDTPERLQNRIHELEHRVYPEVVAKRLSELG